MWDRFMPFTPFSEIQTHPGRLEQPLHWRKPRQIFVCSMGDLFHEKVPWAFVDEIMSVVRGTPQHVYYILTKRPGQMVEYFEQVGVPDNVWLGVTAENQRTADERVSILLSLPGWKKFISVEPMLESVNLIIEKQAPDNLNYYVNPLRRSSIFASYISWVICGAESGENRRECKIEWVRNLKNQCVEAGVSFFYKQGISDDGRWCKMPSLDGRVWNQIPKEKP